MQLTVASVWEIKSDELSVWSSVTWGISHKTFEQSVLELEPRDDVRPTKQHKDSFMPLCHTLPHSALHMHRAFCEIIFQGKYLTAQKLFQYVSSRSKSFLEQPSKTAGGGTLCCNQVSNRGQGRVLLSWHLWKKDNPNWCSCVGQLLVLTSAVCQSILLFGS